MGLTPTTHRDPLAPLKLEPGRFAEAFFKSHDLGVSGQRLWLKVLTVDRDDGTWTGEVLTKPAVDCGEHVKKGAVVTLALEDAEQVRHDAP